jgi:ClpP class serine protease
MEILYILFALALLQPVVAKQFRRAARRKQIVNVENERKSRVILMIHRQETMSFIGFPIARYIDLNDSEEVLRALRMTKPETPIDLVLHTPGGLVLAATQIARAIHKRKGNVRAIVPHYAISGGTLIAMACDEVIMSPHAVLGPVDPQLGQFPASSLMKVVKDKPIADIDDETLILADSAEKAVQQIRDTVVELLGNKFPEEKVQEIATAMTDGRWTHDRPITVDDLKSVGYPVNDEMPREFLDLLALYPQPVRMTPSVEYIREDRRTTSQRI